ncbi:MAG: NUDIX domain-containing protein [Thermoplasmata archaeon]|nr:NUDIX domain-containing protein [Thermoplasmata archaeon]
MILTRWKGVARRASRTATTRPGRPSPKITPALLRWFDTRQRPLPWRRRRNPYRVWVSEVILQQTRVLPAVRIFERFVQRFPNVQSLAEASEEEVLKVWEGAGYYARARRLRAAARQICAHGAPRWPRTLEGWRSLPGVGSYTAAAVASLADAIPVVALDANAKRVAARWTLATVAERGHRGASALEHALGSILPTGRAGAFNEAVMELGETICTPRAPKCGICPVSRYCLAFRTLDDPGRIPPRVPRAPRPRISAAVVALERNGRWLVHRRASEGPLGGLWELPGGKIERGENAERTARRELEEETCLQAGRLEGVGTVRHAYTQFAVELHVFRADLDAPLQRPTTPAGWRWVSPREFEALPRPIATVKAMRLVGAPRGPRSPRGAIGHNPSVRKTI